MQSLNLNMTEKSLKPWIYGFILLHIFIWTLAPAIIRLCLPMDALEGTTWGHQLQWGYDKNPFMNAWLTAFAIKIDGSTGLATYLFCQLSVAACFWSVWELGKRMGAPLYAFIAILLLAATQYYNLHAMDFNDNTLEVGLWGLLTLFFYNALQHNKLSDWLLTGMFAAFSLMTKYFVAVLFIPMLIMMLICARARERFKTPPLYWGLLVFLLIITPHFIWLYFHDFITLNYAFNRVSVQAPKWANHISYPARFAWQQLEVCIPAMVLMGLLWVGKAPRQAPLHKNLWTGFDKLFLLIMGLGPLCTTLLLSAISGMKLRAGWGQPLLTFLSLFLVMWLCPQLTLPRLRRFFSATTVIIFGMLIGYGVAITRAASPSSANFPGKTIAAQLEQEWHRTYHTSLKHVVGARWLAGNIAFYSNDKPAVFIDAEPVLSPWIDDQKIRREGALFVWDPTESSQMNLKTIQKRYPKLGPVKIMHFTWLRNLKMKPVEISVAILPPEFSS